MPEMPPTMAARPFKTRIGARQRRRLLQALVLFGTGLIVTLILRQIQPFHTVDQWAKDQFLGNGSFSPNIVVVGIDNESLETYGHWPDWSRALHAEAINHLTDAGASVIGYDVIFAESTGNDAQLAAAIQHSGRVVLAATGENQNTGETGGLTFANIITPTASLRGVASSMGHVNVVPDFDGKVRRLPLVIESSTDEAVPALSVAILQSLFHMPETNDYQIRNHRLNLVGREIPVETEYFMRLNYTEDAEKTAIISYADVISGNFDPSSVKNKIVIIGMTATGEIDTWAIPNAAGRVPGVIIHAAAMDTILRQQFLADMGTGTTWAISLLLAVICALILPLCGTWRWTDILKGTGVILLLLLAYIIASSWLASHGRLADVFYPSLTLVVLYVANIVFIAVREQADKRFVKGLFGRYVSPEVSSQILAMANNGALALGGEEREISVFFADIRNYTTLSEKMTPEAIVKMLNNHLPAMIEAIVQNGGIVNKFAGDSIMAVWNAPQSQPDHAALAVKAAWEAQIRLAQISEGDNLPIPVKFGIGVNTGKALAGNVGSSGRSEYTVIGDTVNLASRICSATPGSEVWIGPDTADKIGDRCRLMALEPQSFKGKTSPITVYRVVGWGTNSPGP